jgi:hypothetical protein
MEKKIISLSRTCITTALVFPAVVFLLFTGCDINENENGDAPEPTVEAKLTYTPDTLPAVSADILIDGSESSSTGGKTLTYEWVITQKPDTSIITINHIETSSFYLVPDIAGLYVIKLTVVNDTATDQTFCHAICIYGMILQAA